MLLEDYGLIGDLEAAALVGRTGAVDWLCLPRFDSASCFSALLGDDRHGRWLVAPAGEVQANSRRYRPGTLVLETDFETSEGAVRLIDFMPRRAQGPPRVMRIVEGLRGRVPMRMELSVRPDYGSIKPWIELASDGAIATAGPDAFRLSTPLPLQVEDGTVIAEFVAVEGARERLTLTWHLSYEESPPVEDADSALARTEAWWREWSGRCSYRGRVSRRGPDLADRAQGDDLGDDGSGDRGADDLAAGGDRRRAQLGLPLLLAARLGACAGGAACRRLHRRGVGIPRFHAASRHRRPDDDPDHVRDRRRAAPDRVRAAQSFPVTRGPEPVRVGNAASEQFQLDVYGEVAGVMFVGAELLGRIEHALVAALAGHHRARRDDLARARRRDLGGARPAAALHVLEGHGLGRVRPRRPTRRALRAGGARRALEANPRRDPRRGLRAADTTPSAIRSPSTTDQASSTPAS